MIDSWWLLEYLSSVRRSTTPCIYSLSFDILYIKVHCFVSLFYLYEALQHFWIENYNCHLTTYLLPRIISQSSMKRVARPELIWSRSQIGQTIILFPCIVYFRNVLLKTWRSWFPCSVASIQLALNLSMSRFTAPILYLQTICNVTY